MLCLATIPFRKPNPSKTSLGQAFLDELDIRRQSVALSQMQEGKDWKRQANEALSRATSNSAKKYVWSEFSNAQNAADDPALFIAGYQWLLVNQEWSSAKRGTLLHWNEDATFALPSLLAATVHSPEATALDYISRWLKTQQQELVAKEHAVHLLPMQKMCLSKKPPYDDDDALGYNNLILWEHVLMTVLPYLSGTVKNCQTVPYLPYPFESSFTERLLNQADSGVHTWILSNALFPENFNYLRPTTVERSIRLADFMKLVETIENKKDKTFLMWDILHRSENIPNAVSMLENNFPTLHSLLSSLGMFQLDSMRHAVLSQWHEPMQSLDTFELPEDIHL